MIVQLDIDAVSFNDTPQLDLMSTIARKNNASDYFFTTTKSKRLKRLFSVLISTLCNNSWETPVWMFAQIKKINKALQREKSNTKYQLNDFLN